MTHHVSENVKHLVDALSIATVLATLATWLPPLAALLTVIWTVIRIWETHTVQTWVKQRRERS